MFGGAPKCPRCGLNVYHAEEVRAVGKSFHKICLKCCLCKKTLDSTSVNDHENEIFCRTCYSKNFGPKGYGFACGSAGLSTEGPDVNRVRTTVLKQSNNNHTNGLMERKRAVACSNALACKFGGPRESCATCGNVVYYNEKVDCAGKVFHKLCFKCTFCGKLLEKGSTSEHNGDVFCKSCYFKSFGANNMFFQWNAMQSA